MATQEEMDQAAEEAREALEKLDPGAIKVVASWWTEFYRQAGHKRLGRLIVRHLKEGSNGE